MLWPAKRKRRLVNVQLVFRTNIPKEGERVKGGDAWNEYEEKRKKKDGREKRKKGGENCIKDMGKGSGSALRGCWRKFGGRFVTKKKVRLGQVQVREYMYRQIVGEKPERARFGRFWQYYSLPQTSISGVWKNY